MKSLRLETSSEAEFAKTSGNVTRMVKIYYKVAFCALMRRETDRCWHDRTPCRSAWHAGPWPVSWTQSSSWTGNEHKDSVKSQLTIIFCSTPHTRI